MADAFGTIEFGSDQDLYGVWLWGGNWDYQEFRVWGRTMPLKEPSYAATQTARDPG